MKVLSLLSVLILVSTRSASAQQSIVFANYGVGVDAPITNVAGQRIVAPMPYVADLFWSTDTTTQADSLNAAGFNALFSTLPGYFNGGGKDLGVGIVPVLCQVRVWDTNYGSTYYQARDKGGEFGFSNPIIITPSPPPGTPTPLLGLKGFQLQRLPSLTAVATGTNTIVFSWPTEQTAYAVQQNPDISQSNWVTVSNQPVTVGQQQQVILPVPSSGRMFYRLVSQ